MMMVIYGGEMSGGGCDCLVELLKYACPTNKFSAFLQKSGTRCQLVWSYGGKSVVMITIE